MKRKAFAVTAHKAHCCVAVVVYKTGNKNFSLAVINFAIAPIGFFSGNIIDNAVFGADIGMLNGVEIFVDIGYVFKQHFSFPPPELLLRYG